MGTRADFYVGTGPDAEWLGSISYNGDPQGTPRNIVRTTSERAFRSGVSRLLKSERCRGAECTTPDEGWPWPWPDSRTTDYAYAFADGAVVVSFFGRRWSVPGREAASGPKMRDDEVVNMAGRAMDAAGMFAKSGMVLVR